MFVFEQIDFKSVKVAQIGPNIIIGNEVISEYGFVQPWNTYTMCVEDLEGPHFSVNSEILSKIKNQINKSIEINKFIERKYLDQINLGSAVAQASISKLL